jgi:hypothetical protein
MDTPLTNEDIEKQKKEIERLNNIIKALSDTLIDIYMYEYGYDFEEAVSIVNALIKDI